MMQTGDDADWGSSCLGINRLGMMQMGDQQIWMKQIGDQADWG
jgi:hypothetical protein